MVTYINNKNEFDPIVYVIFSMSSQLWGLGNKPSNLVGYLLLQTGKNIMEFYICSLHLHRKIHLMQEKTCRTSTPPRRYIWIFPNYSHFNDAIFQRIGYSTYYLQEWNPQNKLDLARTRYESTVIVDNYANWHICSEE